jgi:hypothetical protein
MCHSSDSLHAGKLQLGYGFRSSKKTKYVPWFSKQASFKSRVLGLGLEKKAKSAPWLSL